jgi:hypothetical protein
MNLRLNCDCTWKISIFLDGCRFSDIFRTVIVTDILKSGFLFDIYWRARFLALYVEVLVIDDTFLDWLFVMRWISDILRLILSRYNTLSLINIIDLFLIILDFLFELIELFIESLYFSDIFEC